MYKMYNVRGQTITTRRLYRGLAIGGRHRRLIIIILYVNYTCSEIVEIIAYKNVLWVVCCTYPI